MKVLDENKRITPIMLFIIGAFLGALCFVGVYGVRVLDFTNNGWLFFGDTDLRQHYIAWCHFRSNSWNFPIGLIDSLSYPNSMSVIYTDSIPVFAVLFKLFGNILPVTFQYFGLFGLLSFMLMGGFSAILLRRFVENDLICIFGSIFYILSFPVIHRMFYHTALASQWIIIAALVLWVYDDAIKSKLRRVIYWGLLGFLCVGIHSYFLPMCGMVLAALMVCQFVKGERALPVTEFGSFCVAGLINLFILGGFYGNTSAFGEGLGTFGSNLNTFVNPTGLGKILPTLPLYYDFQYEGMAYLGIGIFILLAMSAECMIIMKVRKIKPEGFHSGKMYGRVTIGLILVSFFAAVLPLISIGSVKIVHLPYPGFVSKILGIFRSNGRLIWVAYYVIITLIISLFAHIMKNSGMFGLVLFMLSLSFQIVDLSDTIYERYAYFTGNYPVETMWEDSELQELIAGKDEFIFLYDENDIIMMTAYYGYLNGMRQNNYYFARDISSQVEAGIEQYYAELEEGKIRDNAVYILKEEDYADKKELYESLPGKFTLYNSHVIFVSDDE